MSSFSSAFSSFSSASASATLTSILSNITATHSITTTSPTGTPSIPAILGASLDSSSTSYLSSTTTSIIACLVPTLGLMYLALFSWTYQHAQMNPRPMNKTSGVRLQRYAPGAYVFLVLSGLMEVAFASWLILQYRFHANYPNTRARAGVRLLLFASSWTSLTAGAYSLLFLHPAWSRHPVSSVGAQVIWIFVTWLFWVIGAGVVNTSIPTLLDKGTCGGVVYCAQIRGLFGIAVFESLTLSAGMLVMLWLAWQSTRYALKPAVFPMH